MSEQAVKHEVRCTAPDSGHHFDARRHWSASLDLTFEGQRGRTVLTHAASYGPLRVQRLFYPDSSSGSAHCLLLHPPGGLVSGDDLHFAIRACRGADILLTTPSDSKFYAQDSHGVLQRQSVQLQAEQALLEWMPQPSIVFDRANARTVTEVTLDADSVFIGAEVWCFGRPACHEKFTQGSLNAEFALRRDGQLLLLDHLRLKPHSKLAESAAGCKGFPVCATLLCSAPELETSRQGKEALRQLKNLLQDKTAGAGTGEVKAACTLRRNVLVVRCFGRSTFAVFALLTEARGLLRESLTGRPAHRARIWQT